MQIFIHVNEDNVLQGWGSSPLTEADIAVEVEENHPLFSTSPRLFVYQEGQIIKSFELELQRAKDKKDIELNQACKESILAGFSHVINGIEYWFSYDKEAQQNFSDAKQAFNDGLIESINWTVKQDGEYTRIPITNAIMQELSLVILKHKDRNISKYRDELMPQLKAAKTVEEVQALSWA
ncbi:DUF4376 domain-containing protein [Neobacillus vireti]|uniref:DUF4376 domain-containing protein n=1 Tax=Neobacillus vireti TaxID=220686 RepID=UPI002FFDFA35